MKHIRITALLVAAISFAFTACDKKSADTGGGNSAKPAVVDEKTAIANFKTEVETVGKWIEEKQKTAGADPAAGATMVGEIIAKLKGIKTDGLPADLKGAWGEMGTVMTEMGDIFKNMPKIDASKPEEMGKVMGEFMPKMMAIQTKMEPVTKKLEEIGKKYDLDMTKVAPGNK
jgi:hypothetical protein